MTRLYSLRFVTSLCHCTVKSTVLLLPGTAEAEQAAVKLTENAQSLFFYNAEGIRMINRRWFEPSYIKADVE